MDASTPQNRDIEQDSPAFRANPQRGDTYLIVTADYYAETTRGHSRAACIEDICDAQHADVIAVLRSNFAQGEHEDVSAEIADACFAHIREKHWPGHEPYIPPIVEEYCNSALQEWREEIGVAA